MAAKTENIGALIDHTFLKPAGDKDAVKRLCDEAVKAHFASPLGQNSSRVKCFEAMDAIQAGADELDLVVNQRLLKFSPKACEAELLQWVRTCRTFRSDVVLKLILECCNLTRGEIVRGCKMAKKVGFDFVKTSTGFASGGATVEDVALMRRTVGGEMGVKAAGGVRDRETAEAMINAGATRLGTSAGMNIVNPK